MIGETTATAGGRERRRLPRAALATLVAVAPGVVLAAGSTASATMAVVADYQMNETSVGTMRDAGPFDLDGTMGYSIEPGPLGGSVSGYHWDYVPPDAPPADPGRLAVVETTEVLNPGTADFVVEVRYRTTYPQGNVVQKGQSSTDGGYWKVEQNDGKPTCFFRRTSTDNAQVMSWKRVDDGAWHTIRCERTATEVAMYVDGARVARTQRAVGAIVNSFPMTIGGKTACNQISVGCDYFSGDIDFVTISKDVPNVPNTAPTMSIASPTCVTLTCTFDSSGSDDPDGTIADRAWDFGDGSTVAHQDVVATHSFPAPGTYTVTLVGTDDDGASSDPVAVTVTVNGPPNQPPAMSFSWACDAAVCAFDSSASSDADGSIASRRWDFGDGTSSTTTGPTVEHTYAASGEFLVSLVGTDDAGAVNIVELTIEVVIPAAPPTFPGATRFVAVTPARAFDTRPGEPAPGPEGVVRGGTDIEVDVTGVAGVPESGVVAVAVNVAAIGIGAPSYVSARPAGTPESNASNLNVLAAGQVRSNLVIVPVGDGGRISLTTLRDAHLVGDITGYFTAQNLAVAAGRVVTQSPHRLFDTRPGDDPGPKGRVRAGSSIRVPVLGTGGIPSKGVAAVVLNLTATGPDGPGYVTAWPAGAARPLASAINVNGAGETVANLVIVPVGANGSVDLYSSTGVDLLADAVGYVTSAAAPVAATGLFVPLSPSRVFDTRPAEPAAGPKGQIAARTTITPEVAGVAGVPADAGAVALNVTMIGTGPGYATLWPSGATRPKASTVNTDAPGDIRPNAAIVRLGVGGDLDAYVLSPAHLMADAMGYFIS